MFIRPPSSPLWKFRRHSIYILPAFLLISLVVSLGPFLYQPQSYSLLFSRLLRKGSPYYSKDSRRYYSYTTKPVFPPMRDVNGSSVSERGFCENFPTHLLDRVQVVLKTGASGYERNKVHLETVTSCITNILVFSDLEETIGHHHFIDILDDLPESYRVNNPDFAAYEAQKLAHSQGTPIDHLQEGWRFDRFKFLPMIEKTYEMRPHADWYVFLEDDVYIFWDTLFRVLEQLQPSRMHYLGYPAAASYGRYFVYGGGGYVLSAGLMKRLLGGRGAGTRLSVQYENWVKEDCCGDAALAYTILDKTGTRLEGLHPMFSNSDLFSLRVDEDTWCIPLVSLRGILPDQMAALWEWERTRSSNEEPLVYSSILAYTFSHIRSGSTRKSWDNYSNNTQPQDSPTHSSVESCAFACTANPDCLQYSYSTGSHTCRFGKSIQMGKPVPDSKKLISGWDVDKIRKLGFRPDEDCSDSCKQVTWLRPAVQ